MESRCCDRSINQSSSYSPPIQNLRYTSSRRTEHTTAVQKASSTILQETPQRPNRDLKRMFSMCMWGGEWISVADRLWLLQPHWHPSWWPYGLESTMNWTNDRFFILYRHTEDSKNSETTKYTGEPSDQADRYGISTKDSFQDTIDLIEAQVRTGRRYYWNYWMKPWQWGLHCNNSRHRRLAYRLPSIPALKRNESSVIGSGDFIQVWRPSTYTGIF